MVVSRAWTLSNTLLSDFNVSSKMNVIVATILQNFVFLLVLVRCRKLLSFLYLSVPKSELFSLALRITWNFLFSGNKATFNVVTCDSSLVLVYV